MNNALQSHERMHVPRRRVSNHAGMRLVSEQSVVLVKNIFSDELLDVVLVTKLEEFTVNGKAFQFFQGLPMRRQRKGGHGQRLAREVMTCEQTYCPIFELGNPKDQCFEEGKNYSIDVSQTVCEVWLIPSSKFVFSIPHPSHNFAPLADFLMIALCGTGILTVTGTEGAAGRAVSKRKINRHSVPSGPFLLNIYANGLFDSKLYKSIRDYLLVAPIFKECFTMHLPVSNN